MAVERDYVLGTHEEELARLGVQHRVWRPVVLDCWQRAGITVGKRVLDIGAGPGYAAIDLAEIVGPTGEVVAVERSQNFIRALETICRARSFANIKSHEVDLMKGDLPSGDYDFAWCRWVVSFVNDQSLLIEKLSGVMPKGSVAIFHEYGHYETWRFLPQLSTHERFHDHVIATWRESGGEPDAAVQLPGLLEEKGFVIRSAKPHIFCLCPTDYMWQWPVTFIETYLKRLIEMGRIDHKFAEQVRTALASTEKNPNARMLTPLVVEIIAEKL
ncbi:MAG TPA: methyltransferase domain-containing protein [Candidatus Udaeobacter sp.]